SLSPPLFLPLSRSSEQQQRFHEICGNLVKTQRRILGWWKRLFSLKEEKPKMYFASVISSLVTVAWMGQQVHNLFLTYLIGTYQHLSTCLYLYPTYLPTCTLSTLSTCTLLTYLYPASLLVPYLLTCTLPTPYLPVPYLPTCTLPIYLQCPYPTDLPTVPVPYRPTYSARTLPTYLQCPYPTDLPTVPVPYRPICILPTYLYSHPLTGLKWTKLRFCVSDQHIIPHDVKVELS
ncbi:unnamed protein product, partial [Oncorhynchus mykiss]